MLTTPSSFVGTRHALTLIGLESVIDLLRKLGIVNEPQKCHALGVKTRKFFWPLISDLPSYRERSLANVPSLPIAQRIFSIILCLPRFPDLCAQDRY